MAEPIDQGEISWGQRLRSAVLLIGLVVVLGAVAAATTGLVVLALASLIDQALG